jgi:hypothetical protein
LKKEVPAEFLNPLDTSAFLYRGCTMRAIAIGLFAVAFMAVAIPYGDMILKGSQMGIWNTNPGSIFLFFVIAAVLNVALGLLHRSLALDKSELAVVYIMLLIANTLPARGFSGYILPIATGALYYATPENNWQELLHAHLPGWALIKDKEAILHYYEGAPEASIPWDVWLVPLFFWLLFGLALYLVMVSTAVILRKQWVERERLIFPMMQLPLHMIQDDPQRSLIKPFFKQNVMWIGFALPCVITNFNALNHYFPGLPAFSTHFGSFPIFGFGHAPLSISFTLLGFSYFVGKNVAAGLCFFYIFNVIAQSILSTFALKIEVEAVGAFGHYVNPIIMHQAMGAMIALVLIGLWKARSHLGDVCRKTLTGDPTIDDSNEIMSYRQAILLAIGGLLVMAVWLWQAGVPPLVIPVLFFGCFVVFLTITRVVVEGGVAVMFPSMVGPDFAASVLGTSVLGARGGAGLATTYAWATDPLVLLMAACSNGLKLTDQVGVHLRRLFWAILATIALTIAISLWMRLEGGYSYGAINLNSFYAIPAAQYPYKFMEQVITSPVGPNVQGWIHIGIGALAMLALEMMYFKLTWWPFHPLGLPISAAFGSMWFNIFVAWIIQIVVSKYGGAALYRKLKPFFLGLILGHLVTAGIWQIIDFFTGTQGNSLGTFLG